MCQNDAHLFVRPDQIKEEFKKVVDLILEVYKDFGFKDYSFRLSLRDPNDKHKYYDDDEMWDSAESQLREILQESGLDFYEAEGEAAFYGPKLDVQIKTALGHDVTVSTCQLDFLLPQRFELEYIGEDGKEHRPVVIHRAILGTFDRFISFLLEETKGVLPVWLAPVQVKVMPVSDNQLEYAEKVTSELKNQGYCINKKKVQRIVQKLGLQVTSFTRKSRKYSSYKGKIGTVAPNRIRRRFNTHIPHQKITTDTTEFKYYEVDTKGHMTLHKLYLDPFMDMCNGEIISFGIAPQPSAKNVMDALEKAITITADCPYRRTFHSDQGWAYQMKAYSHRLKEERIFQSMSRKGNCHDNSVMENFFGLLKQEIYYGVVYYSYEELKSEIERYIKYYNEQRIKEKLGWMSPVQYRLSLLAA